MKALQARAAGLAMAALLLAGCAPGGGRPAATTVPGTTPASAAPTAAAAATITIKSFEYGAPVTVPPGAVVAVTNMDNAPHTVTADQSPAFDVDVRGAGTATFTAPSAPGTYPYHCTYHPNMKGVLTVK